VDEKDLLELLGNIREGRASVKDAMERLRRLPFEDLGFAKIDHHRGLRQGHPEVIYARGKTPQQVAQIVQGMLRGSARENILVTRASRVTFTAVRKTARAAKFFPLSGAITIEQNRTKRGNGLILVITAGTSDLPVAEEALVTARIMGHRAEMLCDVGVAGIHRLLGHDRKLGEARVIICVAGMEGALPSVVGGLVRVPVIAVPTSTGYGAGAGGYAALLAMLNSCASNVCVVNIDNGFGAACVASAINRL
jgi:pyridinium-3,5-biscarboxylic acid mononucleotide synthase